MNEQPIYRWRSRLKDFNSKRFSKKGVNHTKHKTLAVLKAIQRTHNHPYSPISDIETYDSGTMKSRDLYGFLDIQVGKSERGIQACGTDWTPHIEKLKYEVCSLKLKWWLESEPLSTLELWGWRQLKVPGRNSKEWWPRIQLITPEFIWGDESPTMLSFAALLAGASPRDAILKGC